MSSFFDRSEKVKILLTCIESRMVEMLNVGDQALFNMSKHTEPLLYTFGWKIGGSKRTLGGVNGYAEVNSKIIPNVPSSYGVQSGLKKRKSSIHFWAHEGTFSGAILVSR